MFIEDRLLFFCFFGLIPSLDSRLSRNKEMVRFTNKEEREKKKTRERERNGPEGDPAKSLSHASGTQRAPNRGHRKTDILL